MNPESQLEQLLAECEQRSTPLGSGALNWQVWAGPADARPLLLLHGGFGSWTHWIANIRQLRRSRTLWTLDMPGQGSSGDMEEPLTLQHFARTILDSFNTLHGGQGEFDLAGFSFGALIGSHLAVAAQNRCRHFIACGAAGFGDLHEQVDLMRPPGPETPADDARKIHYNNLRTLMLAREDSVDALAVLVHGSNLARNRFNSRRLARGAGFVEALPDIKARLCGIWGSEDATAGGRVNIAAREALMRRYQPDCAFHILEGVGHWAMYEDAEAFNRIVQAELAV